MRAAELRSFAPKQNFRNPALNAEACKTAAQLLESIMSTTGHFEIKPAAGGEFMFNLSAANDEVILTSQSYASKQGASGGIESVKQNSGSDASYHRKTAKDDSPYFVLVAANGETIGKSEMYSSTSSMEAGIASVKANAHGAGTKDLC
jgi:uncharacterized protein